MERIFADKIFAAEFYYAGDRKLYFDVAKHIYDIAVMSRLDLIKEMLNNPILLNEMVGYKRREESLRAGSDLSDKPFAEFTLPKKMKADRELAGVFEQMERIYIFNDSYKYSYEEVCESFINTFWEDCANALW